MPIDRQKVSGSELPAGWTTVALNSLGEWMGGSTPSKRNKNYWSDGDIPWVSPKDMKSEKISDSIDHITESALQETGINLIHPDALLFVARSGILRHSLPVAVNTVPVTVNQDIKALTVFTGIDPNFLRYQINARQAELRRAIVKTGVTVESINFEALKSAAMVIAPTEEQKRIADALHDWKARIVQARELLDRSLHLSEKLRNLTIQMAFEERDGAVWQKIPLSQIIRKIVAGKNLRCRERPPEPDEKGVVKVSAVTWGEFDPLQSKTLPDEFVPDPKTKIRSGDFLFSRANTLELVGACVIVNTTPDNLYLSDKILRLEIDDDIKPWVLWYFRSPSGRLQLEDGAHGTQQSMLNIPQKSLLNCQIPMPPTEVRSRAIASICKAVDLHRATEAACAVGKANLDTFEKALFKLAFQGKLVPQQPSDTPVENLLVEIREQKKSQAKRASRPRGPRETMEQRPLSDQILDAVSQSPAEGVSFGELRTLVSGQYDAIQQSIFGLLTSSNPRLVQVFDEVEKRMMLKVRQ